MNDVHILTVLKEYWGALLGAVASVMWLARLEGQVRRNAADIANTEARLERQRAEDLARHVREQDDMRAILTEMQRDIKTLLQRRAD